jgi:hypothetical protein
MKLQLGAYDTETGRMLADFPADVVTRLLASSGEHGYQALDATILSSLSEAAEWRRRKRQVTFELNFGPLTVWEGRLEDKLINLDGWSAGALGYWRALRDVLYTALWSWQRYSDFRPITNNEAGNMVPGKFRMSTNAWLFIAPVSGEQFAFGGAADVGGMIFYAPHGGDRKIKKVTFDYVVDLPTGWKAQVVSVNEGFASPTTEQSITTSGSGSATLTLGTDKDALIFQVFNDSGVKGAYTGETEAKFAKYTDLRIWTTDSAVLHADEIAGALVDYVTGINASQLSAATALIEDPGVDLELELYEDQRPADILTDLAGRGDDQTPPRKWEVGVREQRLLYFRPKGSVSRVWHVEAADLALESTLDEVVNSVYSVYRGTDGRTMRTAAATDSNSLSDFGLTRQDVVRARTTSAAKSTTERDATLAAGANPPPRAARLSFDRVTTPTGAGVPLWIVEPGDILVVENLPVELLADPDEINSFRLAVTEFDPLAGEDGRLNVQPESLPPTLETYLSVTTARAANEAAADIRA